MTIREAGIADAGAIAQLHARSWQNTYRGILSDDFLAGPVLPNRLALWNSRFFGPQPAGQIIVVDDCGGEIQGFACAFCDADPEWGTLLDNLHVVPNLKGKGLGRRLMSEIAQHVLKDSTCLRLHLWAYEKNLEARRFYERLGGQNTALVNEPAPDGAQLNAVRYSWSDVSALIARGENLGR
jgi:GNAT superfamily N-acetyltransferase